MIKKKLEDIIEEDLQSLVENSVPEGKTIEYKQVLPGNSDSEKKEFLEDVSSFANTSGGDLIYGIIQNKETGAPEKVEGIAIKNIDQEILRLENIIRDGIEPRILSIGIQPVHLSNNKTIIIIRIPKSWISPHRVSFKSRPQFFSRNSAGKYPLDIGELRIAFNLSETIIERIRNFRIERLSKIIAGETPVYLLDNPKIVLHLVHINSFNPGQIYDLTLIASHPFEMELINRRVSEYRYNFDGFLTYLNWEEGKSCSYVQLFKNGNIEAVESYMLRPYNNRLLIPSILFEKELITSLKNYISILKSLTVEPPIFVFLTLTGVKGYRMETNRIDAFVKHYPIDRDILILPETTIEDYNDTPEVVLKPCFDTIWNACGFPRSLNYNEKGEWKP
ncbi:MAG: helix-turn-helix domain-containing protein [Methanosarcinales archaeon]